MPEEFEDQSTSNSHTVRDIVVIIVAAVYVIASLYLLFEARGRVGKLEAAQQKAATETEQIMKRLGMTESTLKTTSDTAVALSDKLGMTQKEIASRAAQLQREQKASEQRLSEQQKQVSGEVATVKTELGGAKTDIASTKTELEATKSKLERVIGDLGVQSGLIAHTREDLEVLKHRGDRNYYEFTLNKGAKPMPVSTISLQLKKVDTKKGKFTLAVLADDRAIEKKDRTLFEPLQFYTGRDRMLYELVVLTTEKNKVTGYLSTPKSAPVPVSQ